MRNWDYDTESKEEEYLASLESVVPKEERIVILTGAPLKKALRVIAANRHISVADLIRGVLVVHLGTTVNGFRELYLSFLEEEAKRINR